MSKFKLTDAARPTKIVEGYHASAYECASVYAHARGFRGGKMRELTAAERQTSPGVVAFGWPSVTGKPLLVVEVEAVA